MSKTLKIPHIGQVLQDEFLEPLGLSQNALALAIGVPSKPSDNIIRGERSITADTDLRLTKYFGLSKGYFLRLQNNFELLEAEQKTDLTNIVPFNYDKQKKAM